MNKFENYDIRSFLQSFSQDEIERKNQEQIEEDKIEYENFTRELDRGICYLCNEKIDYFNSDKECFHWFTYPKGFKKKYLKQYLSKPIGFFRLDAYFRWLANIEKPFGNINDLKSETSEKSYLETTYRYKNIEWAFSIGKSDLGGHENSTHGKEPHYHIQMKVDNRIILKFNDYHIPFSDSDLFTIEMLKQAGDFVSYEHPYGESISVLENPENLKIVDECLKTTDDEENATFRRQSMIMAKEGEMITGEILEKAFEINKKARKPIAKIISELMPNLKVITQISPGDGVPKMEKRNGRKKK
ncbi:hypothetical protein ACXGQW_00930 [Wenyingzhuangia sp. IMCC45533]